MRAPGTKRFRPAFGLGLATAMSLAGLWGCDVPLFAGGSSSTETGEPIQLSGRVVGNGGEPLPGIVVTLVLEEASDTTDAAGRYEITGRRAAGSPAADTLVFFRGGSRAAARTVTRWVDEVDDVQIIQRGFSGLVDEGATPIHRIVAQVTGDGLAPGDTLSAEFFYNAPAGNYSGFVYFPPAPGTRNYSIRVTALAAGGQVLGRSVWVPFNSTAGNITLPRFSAGAAPKFSSIRMLEKESP